MNKRNILSVLVMVLTFQGHLYGGLWDTVKKGVSDAGGVVSDVGGAVGGAVSGGVDWTVGTVDSSGRTLIGEAGKAGDWIGKKTEDGLKVVDSFGNWVWTEAGKLANAVGCMAQAGVSVTADIVKSLAGAAISFDEISVEGTLGGATFGVKARGRIMQQPFNLSSSIGKDGFSQDGFKQLFYDPLAKVAQSEQQEKDVAAQAQKVQKALKIF
jgi:hypothetical protein